jgi:NADH-quinone oxidoreductase subunit L
MVWLLGRVFGRYVAWLAMLAPVLVTAVGISAVAMAPTPDGPIAGGSLTWLPGVDRVLTVGWSIDGLTALMLLVVGVVALMVMIFSTGYMAGDPGFTRYFAALCLFTGSMSLLVIADGFVGLFAGWELVGASSYLLIGFWYQKPAAAAAAVKAFLTTRVGDVGLLLGIALLWHHVGSLVYTDVFEGLGALPPAIVTAVAVLLFVGAAGKSAQFPLHIWLPDAMEGPTPVSALIHAATMVAAGVFLIARTWPIFEASESARTLVLSIGVLTALMAATIAVVQADIKKVLAYSTISQLGFMFAALGAGAPVAAMFHLTTHAAFKALLFLSSGSVIHGSGTQDMREMGGLARPMRYTMVVWLVGAGALAGLPPLAGFFSKDEVLHAVFEHSPLAGGALFLASLLTAFYITRATWLTFFGTPRAAGHAHESGPAMLLPLFVLAVPAAVLGFAATQVAELLGEHGHALDPTIAIASSLVALVGVAAGVLAYRAGTRTDDLLANRLKGGYRLLEKGYYIDDLVAALLVRPVTVLSSFAYRVIDKSAIDWAVEALGRFAVRVGDILRRLQMGDAQWYGSLIAAGFVVLFVAMTVLGGR